MMKRIQKGKLRVLIATDIAARGIDIPHLDVVSVHHILPSLQKLLLYKKVSSNVLIIFLFQVINAQLPRDGVGYMHRAGRTARMGNTGLVLNFLTKHDVDIYNGLFDIYRRKIPKFDRLFAGQLAREAESQNYNDKYRRRVKERWADEHQANHQFIGADKRDGFKIKTS